MKEEINIEKRTLEQLLKDLREEKDWTYWHVVEYMNKLGVNIDEKTVKKWELGLEYPEIDVIYKISELYMVSSQDLIMAKSNSFAKGMQSVHLTLIRWFCYFTGLSLKIGIVAVYSVIAIALVGSFLFFIDNCNRFFEVRKMMNS